MDTNTNENLPDDISVYTIIAFIISASFFLLDLILDLILASQYYSENSMGYFYATITFVLGPAIIITIIGLKIPKTPSQNGDKWLDGLSKCTIIYYMSMFVLLLGPLVTYFDAIRYFVKLKTSRHRNEPKYRKECINQIKTHENTSVLLKVLECFLEAAPQQVLQIAIVLYEYRTSNTSVTYWQWFSILASFSTMAWTMVSYQRTLRTNLAEHSGITWTASLVQFFWQLCITISRVLCISAFASIYLEYTIIGLGIHWVLVSCALIKIAPNQFCGNNFFGNLFYYPIFGLVHIFTYFNMSEQPTRKKYIALYSLFALEHIIINCMWITADNDNFKRMWYVYPIFFLNILCFLFGLMLMILYYRIFHPTIGYLRPTPHNVPNRQ